MKFIKTIAASLGLGLLLQLIPCAYGFALLGPVAPWMQASNGVFIYQDIGGPMDIGSGYRWNVPVITYGFDKSFLDYFGSNGVAAVESAIKILNDLPRASQLEPTNYPPISQQFNFIALSQGFTDLKSQTLASLLEQLGLNHPSSSIFFIKQWTSAFSPALYPSLYGLSTNNFLGQDFWPDWFIPNYIVRRNFDPETLEASQYINGALYFAYLVDAGDYYAIEPYTADPYAYGFSAVAEGNSYITMSPGGFYTGLTYDDVGGLRYLLSPANVNYEKLLTYILNGSNRHPIVNGAWRPGVDKLTFVRQKTGGRLDDFRLSAYRYADAYYTNNVFKHQQVARFTLKPDILFSAADNGENNTNSDIPLVIRTGTTNWQNNAAENGNITGEGPGIIRPPIKITFHKLGESVYYGEKYPPAYIQNSAWGSYDDTTNPIISYPIVTKLTNEPLAIELRFFNAVRGPVLLASQSLHVKTPIGGLAALQVSTDQTNWNTIATVTNSGSVLEWLYIGTETPQKFFRAIPQ